MQCPYCGAEMRQTRRGATLAKRGPAYVCPNDEAETWTDDQGRKHRLASNARQHGEFVYAWQGDELRDLQQDTRPTGQWKMT